MPDICMCPSTNCAVRKTCYRNQESGTKPDEYWQSYFVTSPGQGEDCSHYWEIKNETSRINS